MSFRPVAAALLLLLMVPPTGSAQDRVVSTRARALFREQQFHDVIELVESARRARIATAQDLLLLSVAYANTGQPERAPTILKEAESLDPTSSSVQLALGSLALEAGDLSAAVDRFRRAYRLDPSSETAVEVLTATLVNQATERVRAGDRGDGYALLREALKIRPSNVVALRNLAVLSLQDGDNEQAARLAEQALLLSPTDADLQRLRVEALRPGGLPERLALALRGLVDVQPEDGESLALLGRTLERLEDNAQALDAYRDAARLGADDPMVYDRLGADALARGDRATALSMTHLSITQAIQTASRLRLGAAGSLESKELTALTAEDWERLEDIARRMEEPLAILDRAIVRLHSIHKTPDELESDLERLSQWYPSSLELRGALADLYIGQARWSEALGVWRQILSDDPNWWKAHLGMGRALWESNRRDDALVAYRRALETAPEEPRVYLALRDAYTDRREALRDLLLERTRRDRQNPVLFEELARVESDLGLDQEAETHRDRATLLRNWNSPRSEP